MRAGVGFIANLNGGQENPPVSGNGRGTGAFILDGSGLHYWVTVNGLSGSINAAHFHNAPSGRNSGVVRGVEFVGNTSTGVWTATDGQALTPELMSEVIAGNTYFNVHTALNRGGEIRGQVVRPNPGTAGLELAFSRSIAGRSPSFAWSAPVGPGGRTTVEIIAEPNLTGRIVGAGGYYTARLSNGQTGQIINTWNSIPVVSGRMINLRLPVGGRAMSHGRGTPIEAAGKIVSSALSSTFISEIGPRVPILTFQPAEESSDNDLLLSLHLANADELAGGAWTLTYNPASLTFQHAQIQGQKVQILEAKSGRVILTVDGLISSSESVLQIVFDGKNTSTDELQIEGFFFDANHMPILALNERISLGRGLPKDYSLGQNHPNPFNPATQIRYALPQSGQILLTIYNTLGQEIARLVDGHQEAGTYVVRWNAENMASGIYYYHLEADGFNDVRKMMLVK